MRDGSRSASRRKAGEVRRPASKRQNPKSASPAHVPITEEMVRTWTATLLQESIRTAGGEEGSRSGSFLRLMLVSAAALMREDFRRVYNTELKAHPLLANGLQPTADMGAILLDPWNVDEILLPAHHTFAKFPVPVFHHSAKLANPSDEGVPRNVRPSLDWAGMRWHSQYVMVCTRCDTPQGPRNTLGRPKADISSIGRQIERILGPGRRITESQPALRLQDEVWGGLMPNISPSDHGRVRPHPMKDISLGPLFDLATGISGYIQHVPEWARDSLTLPANRQLEQVGLVLEKLQCVRCGRLGTIRYLPRILMPIDMDLDPETQADRARRRATSLREARDILKLFPAAQSVFLILQDHPTGELLETGKDLYLLLDRSGTVELDERTRCWPVAMWVHDATKRASGKYWKKLLPRFRQHCTPPIGTPWSRVRSLLGGLPAKLPSQRIGSAKRALATLDLLLTDELNEVRVVLRRDYEMHALQDARKYFRGKFPD